MRKDKYKRGITMVKVNDSKHKKVRVNEDV